MAASLVSGFLRWLLPRLLESWSLEQRARTAWCVVQSILWICSYRNLIILPFWPIYSIGRWSPRKWWPSPSQSHLRKWKLKQKPNLNQRRMRGHPPVLAVESLEGSSRLKGWVKPKWYDIWQVWRRTMQQSMVKKRFWTATLLINLVVFSCIDMHIILIVPSKPQFPVMARWPATLSSCFNRISRRYWWWRLGLGKSLITCAPFQC